MFDCKSPCNNCPYRKDAPREHWSIEEFRGVLEGEAEPMGKVYKCHKNNGQICVGFLMNQDKRGLPSISLRMALLSHGVEREYLDSLHSPSGMFESVEAMCEANFPELVEN